MTTGFVVMLVIAIALIAVVVGLYNAIIGKHNRAQRAWADVLTYERQKSKILDALVEQASQFKKYEKELLEKVTSLRGAISALPQEPDGAALGVVEAQTRGLMSGIKVAVEAYPELKSADIISGLMREIVEQQENVGAAVSIFNRGVEEFNNTIQMFPSSLVNSLFNKKVAITPFSDSESSQGFEYNPKF